MIISNLILSRVYFLLSKLISAEGCNNFGHCVSGQNIAKLKRRLRFTAASVNNKVVIMIGTNDVRRGTPVRKYKIIFREILKLLKGKEVVILTIPPLPLFGTNSQQFVRWESYNNNIRKLKECRIIDIVPLYFQSGTILTEYFETHYNGNQRRDEVHLNASGLKRLEAFLRTELDPAKITEIKGNLFQAPHGYSLAHCVAEDMSMGAGIAKLFRTQFGRVEELLNQNQTVGGLAILDDKTRYVYYLVTKEQSRGKPTDDTLWESLNKLKEHMKRHNVTKLALPKIGCGLDQLE